jgi:hypothetical protein
VGADRHPALLRALEAADADAVARPHRVAAEVAGAEHPPRPGIGRAADIVEVERAEAHRPAPHPDALGVDADAGPGEPSDVDEPRHERDRHDDQPQREQGDHGDDEQPPPSPSPGSEALLVEDRRLPVLHDGTRDYDAGRVGTGAAPPNAGAPMKKIIILLILVAIGVAVAKKVRDA